MSQRSKQRIADDLTIRDAQQQIDEWIQTIGVRYFDELTNLAQLVEEVGEVARILSRTHGEQSPKPGENIGDLAGYRGAIQNGEQYRWKELVRTL